MRNWTPWKMSYLISVLFDVQTLREWLTLLLTCRGSNLQLAFLSKTCTATTLNTWVCGICVLSLPTVYCSHVASRVCAPCRCTPQYRTARRTRAHRYSIRVGSGIWRAHRHAVAPRESSDCDDYCQLVSLRRNASEWLEVQRLDTDITSIPEKQLLCAIRVCCCSEKEGTRCTCSMWVQNILCATRAMWLCRLRSTGSRALASATN